MINQAEQLLEIAPYSLEKKDKTVDNHVQNQLTNTPEELSQNIDSLDLNFV